MCVLTGDRTYVPPHRRQSESSPTGNEDSNNNQDIDYKHRSTSFNDRQVPSYDRSTSYTAGARTQDRRRSDGYGGGYSRRGGNSSTFVYSYKPLPIVISCVLSKLEFQKSQSFVSYSHDSRFRTPHEIEEDWLRVQERNHEYEKFVYFILIRIK